MTKFYKTRDAATSALRKLGVNARDYNLFISKDDTGTILIVDLGAAESHVAAQAAPDELPQTTLADEPSEQKHNHPGGDLGLISDAINPPAAKKIRRAKKVGGKKLNGAKTPSLGREGSVSFVARSLIMAGKTNQEVWDAISVEFQLGDSKRLYPAWYRRELKLKGMLKA